ncbi:hypothetical protein SUGI_1147190 [Cryptomeria japonica]|nr:hypothetical protein SUGI_1147190 [Cryptomeria japonica]
MNLLTGWSVAEANVQSTVSHQSIFSGEESVNCSITFPTTVSPYGICIVCIPGLQTSEDNDLAHSSTRFIELRRCPGKNISGNGEE